jgi:Ca2+-binding RTX toxin-like protein
MVKLKGTSGNDILGGLASDDRIAGLAGNDTLIGAAGFDTLDYGASPSGVTVDFLAYRASDGYGTTDSISGFEEVNGSRFNDVISLGNGAFESAFGHAGNDILLGQGGEDVLRPGSGYDVVDGGSGEDTVSYFGYSGVPDSAQTRGAVVNLATGTAIDPWGQTDKLFNIENVEDSVLNDYLYGNAGANSFTIRGGSNYVDGGLGTDEIVYRKLAVAVNVNLTTDLATRGDGGRDILHNIEDVRGGTGNDTIYGDALANRLDGDAGDDLIYGGDGKNVLLGGAGNDRIVGGPNADYIDGGPGIDTAYYYYSKVGITANLTTDKAKAGLDSDTIVNIERVYGSNYNDSLTGDADTNVLWGAGGNDGLYGAGGNDYIDGGVGTDTAYYGGTRAGYSLAHSGANVVVTDINVADGNSGTDTLHDVEQLWIGGTVYKLADLIF